jgi:hypothetical protein
VRRGSLDSWLNRIPLEKMWFLRSSRNTSTSPLLQLEIITAFIRASHRTLSWASWIQSTPSFPPSQCSMFHTKLSPSSGFFKTRLHWLSCCARSRVVVEALCYKPESFGFETRWSEPLNRPWRSIRFWDIEDPTLTRKSAHRWRWDCQPYAPAVLYLQEDTWY